MENSGAGQSGMNVKAGGIGDVVSADGDDVAVSRGLWRHGGGAKRLRTWLARWENYDAANRGVSLSASGD
jgi:hypothetical protein